MTYDGFLLSAVADELRQTILRGRVQKIRQSSETDFTVGGPGVGHTYLLFVSVDAKFPRVYLTASAPQSLPEPGNFCMILRKYAVRFVRFRRLSGRNGQDSPISISFRPSSAKLTLVLEVMGKHSNLILMNPEGKILGAAKHVGSSISRYRQVLPGREYIPPPGEPKIDPRALDSEMFDRLYEEMLRAKELPEASQPDVSPPDAAGVRQWLMSTFSGFGPFLADEIAARAAAGDKVSRETCARRCLGSGTWRRRSAYEPVLITDPRGAGLMVYPMPSVQYPGLRSSIARAVDQRGVGCAVQEPCHSDGRSMRSGRRR